MNFHNKLNRNLFNKKNFKLLKTFYNNKNITGEDEEGGKDGDKDKRAKTEVSLKPIKALAMKEKKNTEANDDEESKKDT